MTGGKYYFVRRVMAALAATGAFALVFLAAPEFSVAEERTPHGELPLMKIVEVTDLIMSPGCDYLYTLTLCPSGEADQMRKLVKDKLLAGESHEQILDYFGEIYGPRVFAQPARKGFYFVAWWFPYFLLFDAFIIGGVILFVWRKRFGDEKAPETEGEAKHEVSPDVEALLEEEVRKFKEG